MFIPSKPFLPIDVLDSRTVEPVCFPRQAIPSIVKLLLRRTYRSSWAEGQHVIGRDMIARCIVSLYSSCESPTANAVKQVYMLLDTALNGAEYTGSYGPNGELNTSPPIPAAPTSPTGDSESLVIRGKQIALAIDNLVTGSANTVYTDTRNIRQQLDDIIAALQAGNEEDFAEILPVLQAIATALV